jgi:hypothetical protein
MKLIRPKPLRGERVERMPAIGALVARQACVGYMGSRPIDTVAENIDGVLINLSTNDLSRGFTGATSGPR